MQFISEFSHLRVTPGLLASPSANCPATPARAVGWRQRARSEHSGSEGSVPDFHNNRNTDALRQLAGQAAYTQYSYSAYLIGNKQETVDTWYRMG
jgi:hypothetical protein